MPRQALPRTPSSVARSSFACSTLRLAEKASSSSPTITGRISFSRVIPAGHDLLDEMRPVVVAELQVAFAANLTDGEARDLREALDRVRVSACGQG